MKIENLSFPHPVLGSSDDISGNYNTQISVHLDRNEIGLSIIHELNQATTEKLIERKEAAFLTEVHCAQTLFRVSYMSHDEQQTIVLPASDLRDKVDLNFYIVALKDLKDYKVDGANADYAGFSFEISKGDILAYGGYSMFWAGKRWEAQKSVSNLMEVQPYEHVSGPMKFLITGDKIIIKLSRSDYGQYQKVVRFEQFAPIFHSTIVLPALMFAISQMIQNSELYENYAWYQILNFRRQSEEKINKISWEMENVPEIAQAILDNPVERTFRGIWKIINNFLAINEED